MRIPLKLTNAPIAEALLEVRFSSSEIAEIVIGKLASCPEWKLFKSQRLQLGEIPASVRDADPDLCFQPVLQLNSDAGDQVIKLGPRVLSHHFLKSYPGWKVVEPNLDASLDYLFSILADVKASRIGFRYVNLFSDAHFVAGLSDLNFDVRLAGELLTDPTNLNYQRRLSTQHDAIIRVATKEFAKANQPFNAIIDIDIFTPVGFNSASASEIKKWTRQAHDYLKIEFFTLLPDELTDRLEEKQP